MSDPLLRMILTGIALVVLFLLGAGFILAAVVTLVRAFLR